MARGNAAPPISLFSFQDIITSVAGILIFLTLIMTVELIRHKNSSPPIQTQRLTSELAASVPQLESEAQRLEAQFQRQQAYLDSIAQLSESNVREQLSATVGQIASLENSLHDLTVRREQARRRVQDIKKTSAARDTDRTRLKSLEQSNATTRRQLQEMVKQNRLVYTNSDTSKSAWLVELDGKPPRAMRAGQSQIEHRFAARSVDELKAWIRARSRGSEYVILILKPSGVDLFKEIFDDLDKLGVEIGFDLIEEDQTALSAGGIPP